jgi:L-alanine-DL-glutamate epimerase-like enolase superfamily enzyme
MSFIVKSIDCRVRLLPLGDTGAAWAEAFLRGVPVAWTRITADDGTFGDSLVQVDPGGELVPVTLAHSAIAPAVLGARVDSPSQVWHNLRLNPRGLDWRTNALTTLAAIDIALWDLWGKLHDTPLHEAFGAVRPDVPAYVSWGLGRSPLPQLAAWYGSEMDRIGTRAVKTAIGNLALDEDIARVAWLRGELGDGVELAIDTQAQWDLTTAIQAVRRLADYQPYWIEEPTQSAVSDRALEALAIAPIATGENIGDVRGFADLLAAGFHGFIQPDPVRLGGLTPLREVVGLANAYGVPVAPHCYREYAILAATAATTGGRIEHWGLQNLIHDAVYADPLQVRGGAMPLTTRPGVGEVVDPAKFTASGEALAQVHLTA